VFVRDQKKPAPKENGADKPRRCRQQKRMARR